jgi:capsular polysaccharide transport system permease protein
MTTSEASQTAKRAPLLPALAVQCRVVGALMMRELHTRYGRENIGYLWLIGEPLMLGSVIALVHSGGSSHGSGINPVAFAVVGYTIFIMFRGIVNRSEGAIAGNAALLYHRMVTVMDFTIARSLLEAAGTFVAFSILMIFCLILGYADPPPRPLHLIAGIALVFWFALGVSMIVTGGTYERRLLERFVHPFTYFMIPLSGAFFQVSWIPEPYRTYLLYNPLPQIFELVRYGAFEDTTLEYVDIPYIVGFCLVLTALGLLTMRSVRNRIHLQ